MLASTCKSNFKKKVFKLVFFCNLVWRFRLKRKIISLGSLCGGGILQKKKKKQENIEKKKNFKWEVL